MKICIIQKQLFPYFGVMAISGVLKQHGHEIDVLIYSAEKDILATLETIKPELIGFSILSSEHKWLVNFVQEIKQRMPQPRIIVGGVHAVLYPEDVLKIKGVDYICYGDGDIAFPILVERLSKGETSADGITGIGYCKGGVPILQGTAPLLQDLNAFMEDRSIYYNRYPEIKDLSQKIFMSSRGCPFKCSFCANTYIMEIYKGSGKYLRKKSPSHFVEEIKHVIDKYGATSLFFCDDLFVFDIKWLEEFTALYKTRVGVPYICTGRAGVIKERHAKLLSDSGCHTVSFGVETGNEWLRQKILKKSITNKDLMECAGILKSEGIEVQTSNMFCLPEETIEDAVSTIDLNIKMGTDYMFTTIFLPFPKTELAEYCIQKGLLKKDFSLDDMPASLVVKSVLITKDSEYLTNMHKIAHLCLVFPIAKPFLVYLAKNIRCDKLFFFLYLIGTLIRYKKERKLTYLQTIKYLWTYRKGY